jgi:hypothetical protein
VSQVRFDLERRALRIVPRPDALAVVRARVRARARARRIVSAGAAATTALVAVALIGHPVTGRRAPSAATPLALPTAPQAARDLRTQMGIMGTTKGVPMGVVVHTATDHGEQLQLLHADTGKQTLLPADMSDTSVSPSGNKVAGLSGNDVVIVATGSDDATSTVTGSADPGSLSWGPNGSALFARIEGRWRLVPESDQVPGGVRTLRVPDLPGGPTFLSVSPNGDLVLLFGLTWTTRDGLGTPTDVRPARDPSFSSASLEPHLYLGGFDGTQVTDVHPIAVPSTALDGPLGWVGDNAFLLAASAGEALIIRVDGSRIPVSPDLGVDACRRAPPGATCSAEPARLLGTNADGSLLYWRSVASWAASSTLERTTVAYFQTWLDGSNPELLEGAAGRFGPPLAAR